MIPNMTATTLARGVDSQCDLLCQALMQGALPGETDGFGPEACAEAARLVGRAADARKPGRPGIWVESVGGGAGARRLRAAIVNDDMPFLVDSVAGVLAARGVTVHRLLHPVLPGALTAEGTRWGEGPLQSIIYMETDRVDARERRELGAQIEAVLGDVRAVVVDWPVMQDRLEAEAEIIVGSEGATFLSWLADHNFTLLGHAFMGADGTVSQPLGLFRTWVEPPLSVPSLEQAVAWFAGGGAAPLLVKSTRPSTVHRRAPMDLLIVPAENGFSVHAGLWTSTALREMPERVPVLRERLHTLEAKLGFTPGGHADKALRHAVASLPHDLSVALPAPSFERLVLTAMSLADRPRPQLLLLPDAMQRHLFAFVWLPRDELSTARRTAIGDMLAEAADAPVSNWSIELGEGDIALLRYLFKPPVGTPTPDEAHLSALLATMVTGWEPEVEAVLADRVGPARATRLALTYFDAFPETYRTHTPPTEGASDILELCELEGGATRGARLYRRAGDHPAQLRLKTYRADGLIPLSDAVPVLENFGFRVLEELPTSLLGELGYIHDFRLELPDEAHAASVLERADVVEGAIAAVLEGRAENDVFNQLVMLVGLEPAAAVLYRAWFRYLRQTGVNYGLATVVDALRRSPEVARALIAWFEARHAPHGTDAAGAEQAVDAALGQVAAIDDDRILRLFRAVVAACLRTNAYAPQVAAEALAFKLDPALVPGLPAPLPWREIWVYSPRVEGIHLRSGPVARGGLRWSDRRDDFRTEILGLMKAQVVKNAVIVPTGAKGGFYAKQLPPASNREAWGAEGKAAYQIFIRTLLSVTDNIVDSQVVHPEGVRALDGDDPYFVVAADKGTATFSDVANAIALERGFWLGDAFASGGSNGYDHKAMGITAKGAWISVQRHFAEMGHDVQRDVTRVVGCGDMSGDVFGNGMLLSSTLQLVAAFDHRHIFLDPNPDPAVSFAERERMFALPRSSWDDYDKALISPGGGVFPRTQKQIPVSPEVARALGIAPGTLDPASLIAAILRAPADLLWFGGIGTYVKASHQTHVEVGDPANDSMRVDATELRAQVIGEGANLAITQAARIEFAGRGGRINTDFIDNSAGVDCSDNEVNIKIALGSEVAQGALTLPARNSLLESMTDEVAELVLTDNRRQTLALSVAEAEGARGLPATVRTVEILEASGQLDRNVEGLAANDELNRRSADGRGLTRPELAVLLSHAKMALQKAIEADALGEDPSLGDTLLSAFPTAMREGHRDAIFHHRLRREIVSTKVANRFVNRLGLTAPFDVVEEESSTLAAAARGFVAAERLLGTSELWAEIDALVVPESARIQLHAHAGRALRLHISDLVRTVPPASPVGEWADTLQPGLARIDAEIDSLLRAEPRAQAAAFRAQLTTLGAPQALVNRIVRLYELDGAFGLVALAQRTGHDVLELTRSYTRLGEVLGLDWAQSAAVRYQPADAWERLLTAGLARDFEGMRIDFLERANGTAPAQALAGWEQDRGERVIEFRRLVDRARTAPVVTAPMLAQIANQARVLLTR